VAGPRLACALILGAWAKHSTADIMLVQPVDCVLGETCYIQQYVDHDHGTGARDFACSSLTYDGHKGTDFALPTFADLDRDVAVLAAADGTVTRLRDGEADRGVAGATPGRDCGNGVVIDHGQGYETQYCHLRAGSLRVRVGDAVRAGDPVGLIGYSGRAEFPHMQLTLRRDGETVDPFAPDGASCDALPARTLWADQIPYRPGGLLSAGFAFDVPDYDRVKDGTAGESALPPDAPALVLWGYGFGARPGDRVTLVIDGPEGRFFQTEQTLDRAQALYFRAGGRRQQPGGWPHGTYEGTVTLIRDGAVLETLAAQIATP
jgi:murein DD-endopeptidase MepM/ murein hydrolase activator NlpD